MVHTVQDTNYVSNSSRIWKCIFLFLGFVVFITGLVFLTIGIHDKATTANLDVNVDFEKLSRPCTIVGYNYIESDQTYNPKKCFDIYEYYFTVSAYEVSAYDPSNKDRQYVSTYDKVRRYSDNCQNSEIASPSLNIGDLVVCWRPTSVPSKWYKCGNDECIRIFSPVSDIEHAKLIAHGEYMGGTIVTTVVFIILISCILYAILKKRDDARHQTQFWDNFYASVRRRNAEIRSRGTTRREYSARPLRERYNFSNTNQRETNIQDATHVERQELILTHLVHKKVLSKSTNKTKLRRKNNLDELILPHELELSFRQSNRIEIDANSLKTSSRKDKKQKENETNLDKKSNILVETLRSIRSTLNISIRTDHDSTSLYSPKICPICCEDYIKGDDIAWSKNEECCHAFHTDCIVPWLMEHEDCPMCRSDYICIESG